MEKDRLKTFNCRLAADLQKMDDDELWSFILSKEAVVKEFQDNKRRLKTAVFYAYGGGPEWYRKHFLRLIEEYRVGVVYTLILDFCLGDEEVELGYWAYSGFLDDPSSCAVKTSKEIMPNLDTDDEEADFFYSEIYFHLLENNHVLNIIRSMKENLDKLTLNTPEDIDKIEAMREFCEKNSEHQIVYIYDVYLR